MSIEDFPASGPGHFSSQAQTVQPESLGGQRFRSMLPVGCRALVVVSSANYDPGHIFRHGFGGYI